LSDLAIYSMTQSIARSFISEMTYNVKPYYYTLLSRGLSATAELLVLVNFLSRVSILTRDIDTAILSVCPSVRWVPETAPELSNGVIFDDLE